MPVIPLKSTVVKGKSASTKTANDEKQKMKKLEAEEVGETENIDFPPLLLDSLRTKAVLAKVFFQLGFSLPNKWVFLCFIRSRR